MIEKTETETIPRFVAQPIRTNSKFAADDLPKSERAMELLRVLNARRDEWGEMDVDPASPWTEAIADLFACGLLEIVSVLDRLTGRFSILVRPARRGK